MNYKKWLERHRLRFTAIPGDGRKSTGDNEKRGEDEPQETERGPPPGE